MTAEEYILKELSNLTIKFDELHIGNLMFIDSEYKLIMYYENNLILHVSEHIFFYIHKNYGFYITIPVFIKELIERHMKWKVTVCSGESLRYFSLYKHLNWKK
jgi:hypothetical protein